MRVGDFSVEVVAPDSAVRELESGHVLTRVGQVYVLRLRNHGPLRCVTDVSIDGQGVTAGGLVLDAWSTVDLERPIHATERGRFTVIAEGDERVFGPDGGRDNPDLGLIEARFRRELPDHRRQEAIAPPAMPRPILPHPTPMPEAPNPHRPMAPPEWTPPIWNGPRDDVRDVVMSFSGSLRENARALVGAADTPVAEPAPAHVPGHAPGSMPDAIERAAGTGLTGSSRQEFVPAHVGRLETEATVIRLRLVIGTEEALSAPRPLPDSEAAPARPAARP